MSEYNPKTNEPTDDDPRNNFPDNNSSERPMATQGTQSQGHPDNILHTPSGRRGRLDLMDWFDGPADLVKHETAYDEVETGSRGNPSRDLHDDALQVVELRPDTLITTQFFLPANAAKQPIQIAWANPERKTLRVFCTGTPVCLIGQRQSNVLQGGGFAFPTAAVIILSTITDLWIASLDNVAAVSVYVLEEVRNSDRN